MTDPMWTVIILAVLWMIVVVPMVVQRKDARAGQRSAAKFASAMRLLGSRRVVENTEYDVVSSPIEPARAIPSVHVSGVASRRPVPAAKESLMLPPDRHGMSEARRQMLARRRRSLACLTIASIVFLLGALIVGGAVLWVIGLLALAGLIGYLVFLRTQARTDRARRETRRAAAAASAPARDHDATSSTALRISPPESVVRIDEEDIALDHLDTVDLTGLYSEVELQDNRIRRAG